MTVVRVADHRIFAAVRCRLVSRLVRKRFHRLFPRARTSSDNRWLNQPPVPSTYLHTIGALAHAMCGQAWPALAEAQALIDGLEDARSSGRRSVWLCHYLYFRLRVAAMLDDAETQRAMARLLRQSAHRPVNCACAGPTHCCTRGASTRPPRRSVQRLPE